MQSRFWTLWVCSAQKAFRIPFLAGVLIFHKGILSVKLFVHSAGSLGGLLLWPLLPFIFGEPEYNIYLIKFRT